MFVKRTRFKKVCQLLLSLIVVRLKRGSDHQLEMAVWAAIKQCRQLNFLC